jgi:hypothetical protein
MPVDAWSRIAPAATANSCAVVVVSLGSQGFQGCLVGRFMFLGFPVRRFDEVRTAGQQAGFAQ